MSSLLTVEAASELLNTSQANIMTTACNYKKEHNRYPKWYVSNGKRGASKSYVDMGALDDNRQLVRSTWIMCTDYLYWLMSYDFEMSDNYIASQLAKRSELYPSSDSWVSFLRNTLFQTPQEVVFNMNSTMMSEFLKISTRIIALASRES